MATCVELIELESLESEIKMKKTPVFITIFKIIKKIQIAKDVTNTFIVFKSYEHKHSYNSCYHKYQEYCKY